MNSWRSHEIQILINSAGKYTIREISDRLGKSVQSTTYHVKRLGLDFNKWSQEDLDFLKQNSFKFTVKQLAEKLNKGQYCVRRKIKELRLEILPHKRRWTEQELKFLITDFSLSQKSSILGRSKQAIMKKQWQANNEKTK